MAHSKQSKYILTLAILIMLSGCSYTKLTSSWFDIEAPPHKYKKIAVVALTPNKSNRALLENNLASQLQLQGINGVNTLGIFPRAGDIGDEKFDREEIERKVRDKVKNRGIDALLMVALLDIEEDQYHVRGDVSYYKDAYYDGGYGRPYAYPISSYPSYNYSYYGYYSNYYSAIYSPDYYINTTSYYIETSLFDTKTEKLVWSAQTSTTDPTSVKKETKNFAELIVNQMMHDRVLKTN